MQTSESNNLPLIYLLNTYARASRSKIEFPSLGNSYTLTEIQLMRWIKLRPGSSIKQLCDLLGLSKSSISPLVSRFQVEGIVRKDKQPGNLKELAIYLTEKGETQFTVILKKMKPLFGSILSRHNKIPMEYWLEFGKILNIITKSLEDLTS